VCVCVKFCFKLGKTATETWKMLQQAFGDECMSQTQCFEWYSRFKKGRMSIDEDPRSGRSSTSTDDVNIDVVRDLILQNRRLNIREIAEDVDIKFGSCQAILTEKLNMHRVASKFVHVCRLRTRKQTMLTSVNNCLTVSASMKTS
jgi:hypothetical protein